VTGKGERVRTCAASDGGGLGKDAIHLRRVTGMSLLRAFGSVLVTLSILLSSLGQSTPVRADELSDARARQAQLQQSIEKQRQVLSGLRSDQQTIKKSLGTTANKIDSINADQADLRKQIDDATAELNDVQARYDGLVHDIGQLDWTLGILQDELDQGERDLSARRRLLAARLDEAYRTQQTSLLEQVLSSGSFTDVLGQVDSFLRFGDQDKQLAAQIQRDQDALQSLRQMTTATRYRTDQLRLAARQQAVEISHQRSTLQAANLRLEALESRTRDLQAQQLAHYNQTIANGKQAAADLTASEAADQQLEDHVKALIEAEQARLAAEAERKRKEAEARRRAQEERWRREHATPPPAPAPRPLPNGNGMLRWPVAGVVTQEFGCTGFPWEPPRGNCAHFHQGIDIANRAGTPIHAAAAGLVVFVGYNPYDDPSDPAWIVSIVHVDGIVTWYAHLQARAPGGIHAGTRVRAGQIIGYMGTTGHSTGVHLHWQVEKYGTPVNPRKYV
jgi:murein DD-endopeptidase MepM/ murein hydrolase activator NlpD